MDSTAADPLRQLEKHIGHVVATLADGRGVIRRSMKQEEMHAESLVNVEQALNLQGEREAARSLAEHSRDALSHSVNQVLPMKRHIKEVAGLLREVVQPRVQANAASLVSIMQDVHDESQAASNIAADGKKKLQAIIEELRAIDVTYADRAEKARHQIQERQADVEKHQKKRSKHLKSFATSAAGAAGAASAAGAAVGASAASATAAKIGAESAAASSLPQLGAWLSMFSPAAAKIGAESATANSLPLFGPLFSMVSPAAKIGAQPAAAAASNLPQLGSWFSTAAKIGVESATANSLPVFGPLFSMVSPAAAATAVGIGSVLCGVCGVYAYKACGEASHASSELQEAKQSQQAAQTEANESQGVLEKVRQCEAVVHAMMVKAEAHQEMWRGLAAAAKSTATWVPSKTFDPTGARQQEFNEKMKTFASELEDFVQAIERYLFLLHKKNFFPPNYSLKQVVGKDRFLEMEREWQAASCKAKTEPTPAMSLENGTQGTGATAADPRVEDVASHGQ